MKIIKSLKLGVFFTAALSVSLLPMTSHANLSQRKDVQRFIDKMVKDHQFERNELAKLFESVTIDESIIDAITKPAEGTLPWYKYRNIFMTKSRIDGGVKFWRDNEKFLAEAEKRFGVPPEIVVAIIGVESRYGEHKGKHSVLRSLSTLAFGYPKRSKFFTQELEHYLILARDEKLDIAETKGSYAGAVGKPQFIPSSYRNYAVDFDDDGRRDLWKSDADVIGSVANYFAKHKWKRGEPVVSRARATIVKHIKPLIKKGIRPKTTLAKMEKLGVKVKSERDKDRLAAFFALKQPKRKEYWVGFNNFYSITRYNHSKLYAMAVYQLSQAIRKKHLGKLALN